jgi:hypothetical protein
MTAFEEHMLVDDRPSHPMVIVARFDFVGEAPMAALASAFNAVVRREPLLTARVVRSRFGRPRWMPGPLPELHVSKTASPPKPPDVSVPRLDPEIGPMVHAEVIVYPAGWSLVVVLHHAACDGLGMMGFMERWLLAAAGREGHLSRQATDVLACLRGRGRVATSWRGFVRMLPGLSVGIAGVRQFISRRVAGLGGRRVTLPDMPDMPSISKPPEFIVADIDPATYAEVKARGRADGVTVNDLLAASLMATIADVADTQGAAAAGDAWIRLSVPISLRTKSDDLLPAANRVSMVFLDRTREQCNNQRSLVEGIHTEMDLIRLHALGHILPLSLEAGRLAPGGLARTAKSTKPQATAVLSNLGWCFHRFPLVDDSGTLRLGNSHLEGWWFVPPVRPGTPLAVATHETCGRRTIAAHVDTTALDPAVASAILAGCADRLLVLARQPPATAEPSAEVIAS